MNLLVHEMHMKTYTFMYTYACNLSSYTCVNLYLLKMEYTMMSSCVTYCKDIKLYILCVCPFHSTVRNLMQIILHPFTYCSILIDEYFDFIIINLYILAIKLQFKWVYSQFLCPWDI